MSDEKCYYLYMHKFPNNKVYIGLTKQIPQNRWSNGNGYKQQQKIYNAIQKYGWENIEHIILYDKLTQKEAQKLEIEYIEKYDSVENGYNDHIGGCLGGNEWKEYEYQGKIYSPTDLLNIANKGITAHDITTRIWRGWEIDRAINQVKNDKKYLYTYKNKDYSIDELYEMKTIDISRRAFLDRLRSKKNDWTIERALNQPTNKKNQPYLNYYEYDGKKYNIQELCELSNVKDIKIENIRDRIERGWTIERAITQPLKTRNKLFEYNGKMYTSKELVKLSPIKEITCHHITDRINSGWCVEKAINTPIKKK